jgi:hypothetical protein
METESFKTLLHAGSESDLLSTCLHDASTPFVFSPRPDSWEEFRMSLKSSLGVDGNDIRIIGSGRFGFSMKPGRNFKAFNDQSDIDVVIVNAHLFDSLWQALLEAAYPRGNIHSTAGGWLKDRRNELYTGWITPLEINLNPKFFGSRAKAVAQTRLKWFDALKNAAQIPPRRHEDINSRLYRTWRHAELYHLSSLSALRQDTLKAK